MTYASCVLTFVKRIIPNAATDLPIFYMNLSPMQISETGKGNKTKHSSNQPFCMGVTHRVLHKVSVPFRGNPFTEYLDQYRLMASGECGTVKICTCSMKTRGPGNVNEC